MLILVLCSCQKNFTQNQLIMLKYANLNSKKHIQIRFVINVSCSNLSCSNSTNILLSIVINSIFLWAFCS